jgi:CRISPR-associated exonuclease Cas4
MFADDEMLPVSALQHFVYCPRQAALIHLERAWRDNVHTVEGTHLHETADSGTRESRGAIKILRSVTLVSTALGLSGKADVVELRRTSKEDAHAVQIEGAHWIVRPVEYKRGRPKKHRADEVQLCAQTFCLEEMLGIRIEEGDLFYGATRRRRLVRFEPALRELTIRVAHGMHAMFASSKTPPAEPGPKCRECSLQEICRPYAAGRSASRYVRALFREAIETP